MIGAGNAMLSTAGGIWDGMVFRVGLSFLFAYPLKLGVTGFFLGDALSRSVPLILSVIYYYSGAWKKRKPLLEKRSS